MWTFIELMYSYNLEVDCHVETAPKELIFCQLFPSHASLTTPCSDGDNCVCACMLELIPRWAEWNGH